MGRTCCYGLCNSDERYPERIVGVRFIPFPKPKTKFEKCTKWIRLCGRPHYQLHPAKITKDTYICTKHFVNADGPTDLHPDPLPAVKIISHPKPARKPPTKRKLNVDILQKMLIMCPELLRDVILSAEENVTEIKVTLPMEWNRRQNIKCESIQTGSDWVEPKDFNSLLEQNAVLKRNVTKHSI